MQKTKLVYGLIQTQVTALNNAGYVIVPIEPTEEMLASVYGRCGEHDGSDEPAKDYWNAMVTAAMR